MKNLCLAAWLALSPATVLAQGAAKPRPVAAGTAQPAAAEEAAPEAAPASEAVNEKFRKLQKEMARPGGPAPADREAAPAAEPERVGVVSLSLQIVLGLAFVLLLAVVSIRLLKRLQGRMLSRPGQGAGADLLEVMETCHLGQSQRVVALRIHDEVGVLGVTPHGISLLTVLKQPAEEIRKQRVGNPTAFSDNLNKLLQRFQRPKQVSDLLDEQE